MLKSQKVPSPRPFFHLFGGRRKSGKPIIDRQIDRCPYCSNKKITKHGHRENKFEIIQYYRCHACSRLFTPQIKKHKTYPLRIVLDAISFFNLGYKQIDACRLVKEKYGLIIKPSSLARWIKELTPICRYSRIREQARKLYPPTQIIQAAVLNHKQVYHFRFHQAKLELLCKQRPYSCYRRRQIQPKTSFKFQPVLS
jgi:transposase-like protein